jgi:hypothetical protein
MLIDVDARDSDAAQSIERPTPSTAVDLGWALGFPARTKVSCWRGMRAYRR